MEPRPIARDDVGMGIALACGAVLIFSSINALAKWQAARYSLVEIVFFRSLFALVPVLFLAAREGFVASLRTSMPGTHLLRSSLWLASVFCTFASYYLLPLADAAAISFSAPLFLTALSALVLGERVGIHRWVAVIAGFAGVLVMVRPGMGILDWGAIFGLANAVCYALGSLAVRQMASTERSVTIVFYTMLLATVVSAVLLPFVWVTPTLVDLAVLVALGLLGGLGQLLMVQAFHYAPASSIAPWNYTSMIWAVLLGWLVWSDFPDAPMMLGAAIVIGSGLYLVQYERRVIRSQARHRHRSAGSAQ